MVILLEGGLKHLDIVISKISWAKLGEAVALSIINCQKHRSSNEVVPWDHVGSGKVGFGNINVPAMSVVVVVVLDQ